MPSTLYQHHNIAYQNTSGNFVIKNTLSMMDWLIHPSYLLHSHIHSTQNQSLKKIAMVLFFVSLQLKNRSDYHVCVVFFVFGRYICFFDWSINCKHTTLFDILSKKDAQNGLFLLPTGQLFHYNRNNPKALFCFSCNTSPMLSEYPCRFKCLRKS